MKHTIYTILGLLLICLSANAQERLSNSFTFTNGLYRSYEEFKDNRPSLSWQEVTSDLIVMEMVHRAKMGGLVLEVDDSSIPQPSDSIDITEIWGFCVNGIPYMRTEKDNGTDIHIFSGLRLRGRICYLEYEVTTPKKIEVSAYNPQTGKPFRTATLTRNETVNIQQLIDFETGKEAPYTIQNVEKWIASDSQLLGTFQETSTKDKALKLFKFLQIFNDRNPILMNN